MTGISAAYPLREYWAILVRRRWVVALSIVSVALVALIGSFLVTPKYRATVILQIERQRVGTLDDASEILDGFDDDSLLLLVRSGELTRFVVLEK